MHSTLQRCLERCPHPPDPVSPEYRGETPETSARGARSKDVGKDESRADRIAIRYDGLARFSSKSLSDRESV